MPSASYTDAATFATEEGFGAVAPRIGDRERDPYVSLPGHPCTHK